MVERTFVPGSEWLYLKVYTGIKTSDIILDEAIKPLTEYLVENSIISQWFFIRYSDPKPHLRIRFLLNDIQHYNEILEKVNVVLQGYMSSGEISDLVLDTYKRELERYGERTIEEAEELFCINSKFTLQCLPYDDEEKIIVCLFYIDELLNKTNIPIQEKLRWIRESNEGFKQEFNADKKLNSQLDKKYRDFRPKYLDFTSSEEFSEERGSIIAYINESNEVFQNVVQSLRENSSEISLQYFFQSIFHMNINRIFISNQRLFEMLIYDFLLRHYKRLVYHSR